MCRKGGGAVARAYLTLGQNSNCRKLIVSPGLCRRLSGASFSLRFVHLLFMFGLWRCKKPFRP